jgi:hypothetical protein
MRGQGVVHASFKGKRREETKRTQCSGAENLAEAQQKSAMQSSTLGGEMKSWSESVTATSRKVYSIWVENHEANESASTPVLTSDASMQLQILRQMMTRDDTSESLETRAVKKIQRLSAARHASKQSNTLGRKPLVERLELDLDLIRGLRLLFFCAVMFGLVIYAANLEKRSAERLGLLNTFSTIFALNADALYEIKTAENFFDFLRMVSEQSRLLQPLSSQYFIEETGEMKIMSGVRKFLEEDNVEVEGLEPAIDSAAFSLTAWIRLKPGGGANVIRKPLGKTAIEKPLSCWGWYVGHPSERFFFGAHDFRGGASETAMQESISGDSTLAADGRWHLMAVVVNQTSLSFYTDAELQKEVPLLRPVTDCSGRALIIGQAGTHSEKSVYSAYIQSKYQCTLSLENV